MSENNHTTKLDQPAEEQHSPKPPRPVTFLQCLPNSPIDHSLFEQAVMSLVQGVRIIEHMFEDSVTARKLLHEMTLDEDEVREAKNDEYENILQEILADKGLNDIFERACDKRFNIGAGQDVDEWCRVDKEHKVDRFGADYVKKALLRDILEESNEERREYRLAKLAATDLEEAGSGDSAA